MPLFLTLPTLLKTRKAGDDDVGAVSERKKHTQEREREREVKSGEGDVFLRKKRDFLSKNKRVNEKVNLYTKKGNTK